MVSLSPEAGGRFDAAAFGKATTYTLFERYIQSVERTADLICSELTDLLAYDDWILEYDGWCRFRLLGLAEYFSEEGASEIEKIAPDDFETLVPFLQAPRSSLRANG